MTEIRLTWLTVSSQPLGSAADCSLTDGSEKRSFAGSPLTVLMAR